MGMEEITIRQGTEADVSDLLKLIQELAEYEKEPDAVIVTEDILKEDGFGSNPSFGFFVAEVDGVVHGIALYCHPYSTWKGRYLYLEDLVVRQSFRGKGLGAKLFEAIVEKAKAEGVKRLGWQVLDWNEPAIKFYEKYGADMSSEWLNGRLYFD